MPSHYPADASIPAVWRPGDVLLDLYEVREVLGMGGMGQVLKVYHRGWDQVMAVKSPRPEIFSLPHAKEAFEREAETWVKLGLHVNTATCFYVRRMGNVPRVFSEYVDGGSLQDWITGVQRTAPRLYLGVPEEIVQRILDISIQIAWGLHHAHQQSLVHQDVKPANVLLTQDGIAKVTDFGLARSRSAVPGIPTNQDSLLVSGGGYTPAFCSPEQERGEKLTPRTDIWSWAVSILHMFSRRVTWKSGPASRQALEEYLGRKPDQPDSLPMPKLLVTVLRDCLEEDLRYRPRDFPQIIFALQEAFKHVSGAHYPRPAPIQKEDVSASLNNRAVSLLDLGMKQEAEITFERALEFEPQHVEATYNLGLLCWRDGRISDAQLLARIRETMHGSSGQTLSTNLEALVLLERGDVEAGLETIATLTGSQLASLQPLSKRLSTLHANSRRFLRSFVGHTSRVLAITVSPDGKYLASSGVDRIVRLWELESGKCIELGEGHTHRVECLCFSPDGGLLASGADDRVIRVWDVASSQCVHVLRGHLNGIKSLCFLSGGAKLVSGSFDETFKLWDVARGVSLWTFEDHAGGVFALQAAMDEDQVWSVSGNGTITLWDLQSKNSLLTWKDAPSASTVIGVRADRLLFTCVGFRADGQRIMFARENGTAEIWDTRKGEMLNVLAGEITGISAFHWPANSRFVLAGSANGLVQIWDTETGRCLRTFEGFKGKIRAITTDPSAETLFVADQSSEVKAYALALEWHQPAPTHVCRIQPTAQSMVAADEHSHLITRAQFALGRRAYSEAAGLIQKARLCPGFARSSEALNLWSCLYRHLPRQGLQAVWMQRAQPAHSAPVRSVAVCSGQQLVVSASDDETVKVWDLASRRCTGTLTGHFGKVLTVAVSPDGVCALSGGEDEVILVWDMDEKKCIRRLQGHQKQVIDIHLTPDGKHAASASGDGTLRIWRVADGECLQVIQADERSVSAMALDSTNSRLVSAGEDNILRFWSMTTGKQLGELPLSTRLTTMALHPTGRYLLAGDQAGRIQLWKLKEGRVVSEFHADGPISRLGFCKAGTFAFACGKRALVWNLKTQKGRTEFAGNGLNLTSATFSPDFRWLISGGGDGHLHYWFLDWLLNNAPHQAQVVDR